MVFQTVLSSPAFTPVERDLLNGRIAFLGRASRISQQVAQNLWTENRLPAADAEAILRALLHAPDDPDAAVREINFKDAYVTACRQHKLAGPVMLGRKPDVVGKAITVDAFCDLLVAARPTRPLKQTRTWLRRQCGRPVSRLRPPLRAASLGRHAPVWATFLEPDRNADPFAPLPGRVPALHDALGLHPDDRGRPLLLLIYRPPAGHTLRFPTVADAGWNELFRPAPPAADCPCGYVRPLAGTPGLQPLPEVVHEMTTGAALCYPLRIIR